MNKQEQHEMLLETTHSSGAEGWYCPTCGRRMLITWGPRFNKIVLEAGDDHAIHSASKGDAQIGPLRIEAADPANTLPPLAAPSSLDLDPRLIPWLVWLNKIHFEDLWNDEA